MLKTISGIATAVPTGFRLAEQLAPCERPGLAEAHLFLALVCLRGESGMSSTTAQQLAAKHLDHLKVIHEKVAEDENELPLELRFLFGLLRLQQNQIEEAQEIFQELSPRYWPATVISLDINFRLGRKLNSRIAAEQLLRWTRMQASILGKLSPDCFSVWYRIEKQTDESSLDSIASDDAGRYIAEHWLRQFSSDSRAAEACLFEFDREIESLALNGPTEKRRAASTLISLAGIMGVQHRDRLANWLIPKMGQPQQPTELAAALELAEQSNLPAVLLEILGTAAIANGEFDQA